MITCIHKIPMGTRFMRKGAREIGAAAAAAAETLPESLRNGNTERRIQTG